MCEAASSEREVDVRGAVTQHDIRVMQKFQHSRPRNAHGGGDPVVCHVEHEEYSKIGMWQVVLPLNKISCTQLRLYYI